MKKNKTPHICFWPGRERGYSRNRVLLKAMDKAGLNVYDCSYPRKSLIRYWIGFFRFLKYKGKADIIFVGFLGHFIVPIVKLFTRKKIVFDVFVSVYETMALDRRVIKPSGILANLARWIDRHSCQLADTLICDTNQHIDYFVNEYALPQEKFVRIFVGSDDVVMYPQPQEEKGAENFLVHFHGEFQELHGVEYIIEAAAQLPDVQFQIIGKGKLHPKCKQKARELNLQNVRFLDPVPYEKLPDYMAKADICLGIFGDTPKAQMVIPHKVFEALAMGKPLITANTPAARELLTDGENVLFCKIAHPENLVEKIKEIKNHKELFQTLSENSIEVFQSQCGSAILGEQIQTVIQGYI